MSSTKHNATCSICGKEYTVCQSCIEQKTFKPWRTVTDTIEHYKIYLAIHGYTISKDKKQAKQELENCDLSELDNFNSEIKFVIKEIMKDKKIEQSNENLSIVKSKNKRVNITKDV